MLVSSPLVWGCFRYQSDDQQPAGVFPTRVGGVPMVTSMPICSIWSSPQVHRYGGVSEKTLDLYTHMRDSPRTWGISGFLAHYLSPDHNGDQCAEDEATKHGYQLRDRIPSFEILRFHTDYLSVT
jgi:hypothetical protein